jgi:hypothetical protein
MSAAIGGTAKALGGGKFANGAVSGAYVMMFNYLMQGDLFFYHHLLLSLKSARYKEEKGRKTLTQFSGGNKNPEKGSKIIAVGANLRK